MKKVYETITTTYGAAELKGNYRKYLSRGMFIAAAMHIIAAVSILFALYFENLNAEKQTEDAPMERIITLVDLPPMINEVEEEKIPEVKEEKKTIVPKKDLAALTPQPVKRVEVKENITMKVQSELDKTTNNVSSTGDENANNTIDEGKIVLKEKEIEKEIEKEEPKKENPNRIFQPFEVSRQPNAVNLGQVQGQMRYPEIAVQSQTEGRVSVTVLVDKSGSVMRIGKISGPSVFHDEVRDKVYNLRFTPAMQDGSPVNCWVTVPFNFKLKSGF